MSDTRHPYIGLPDKQFWKKEPALENPSFFDPFITPPFKIAPHEPVVTAGSCFAQHVARYLSKHGFNHLITEKAHPLFDGDIAVKHNYGVFAARYGNVYTSRQLKQLILRAFGEFEPVQNHWNTDVGTVVDPFRPQIQPNGFVSIEELDEDRVQHFSCIREALSNASIFVFTLGLTESWVDPNDGAVFPIAPGIAGGVYNESTAQFKNFDVTETVLDLEYSLEYIRKVNPSCKVILTVSPVPLNATYEKRHVLLSTTYSKAVLRIAAEEVCRNNNNVTYFPSYEIITGPYSRGAYFDTDCRSVTQNGVDAVMNVFLKNFGNVGVSNISTDINLVADPLADSVEKHLSEIQSALDVLCDEEAINNG